MPRPDLAPVQVAGKEASRLRRKGAPKPIKVVCHIHDPRPAAEQRALLPKPAVEGEPSDDVRYRGMPLPRLPPHELRRRFAFLATESWGIKEFRQRTGYQEFPWPARSAGAELDIYIESRVSTRVDVRTDCKTFRPDDADACTDAFRALAHHAGERAAGRAGLALGVHTPKPAPVPKPVPKSPALLQGLLADAADTARAAKRARA